MERNSMTSGVRWSGIKICQGNMKSSFVTVLVIVAFMTSSVSAFTWIRKPESLEVKEGATVTLFCEADDIGDNEVYWVKDNLIIFSDNKSVSDAMPGYSVKGKYNLEIQNVDKNDDAEFICQIGSETVRAQLTVWIAPGEPTITFSKTGPLSEGEAVDIVCHSEGGKPAPTMRMYKNNKPMSGISSDGSTSTFTVSRTLTFDDNKANYTCSVYNVVNTGNPKNATIALSVLYAPRLSLTPYNPFVMLRGGSGAVQCQVSANPQVTSLQWTKDTVVQSDKSNLSFTNVKEAQKGTYVCKVLNSIASREIQLTVDIQYPPEVTVLPATSVYKEQDDISVSCNYQSNPPPSNEQIVWYKLGTSSTWKGQTLHFPKADRQHGGSYSCNVTNILAPSGLAASTGAGSAIAQITVQYAPGPVQVSGSSEVVKGERAELTCSSADPGVPSAGYKWRKKGSSTILSEAPSLVIVKTELSSDGIYECIPHNTIGDGPVGEFTMTILERPEWQKQLPNQQQVKITERDFSLTCQVRGKPKPEVTWEKDGAPLVAGDEFYSVVSTSVPVNPNSHIVTGKLLFKGNKRIALGGRQDSLRIEDSGNYTCYAKNTYGRIFSMGKLVLNYRPVIDPTSTRVAIDLGQSATINCLAHALPSPSFQWFFNNQPLSHNGKTILIGNLPDTGKPDFPHGSQLNVEAVTRANLGVYRCEAANLIGTSTSNVTLSLKTVPQPPTNLESLNSTWDSIIVQWQPGFNGGFAQTFYINYNTDTIVVPESMNVKKISGLLPNTTYTIRMYAKNNLGQGIMSASIQVKTEDFPFPPVRDVKYHITRQTVTFVAPDNGQYCVRVDVSRDEGKSLDHVIKMLPYRLVIRMV